MGSCTRCVHARRPCQKAQREGGSITGCGSRQTRPPASGSTTGVEASVASRGGFVHALCARQAPVPETIARRVFRRPAGVSTDTITGLRLDRHDHRPQARRTRSPASGSTTGVEASVASRGGFVHALCARQAPMPETTARRVCRRPAGVSTDTTTGLRLDYRPQVRLPALRHPLLRAVGSCTRCVHAVVVHLSETTGVC